MSGSKTIVPHGYPPKGVTPNVHFAIGAKQALLYDVHRALRAVSLDALRAVSLDAGTVVETIYKTNTHWCSALRSSITAERYRRTRSPHLWLKRYGGGVHGVSVVILST